MIGLLRAFALTGGEWVIYILIICSVISIGIMIERGIIFKKEKEELKKVLEVFDGFISRGQLDELASRMAPMSGAAANVIKEGLKTIPKGIYITEESMNAKSVQERRRLDLRMVVINTLGNNAVYIGLFGTVLGVIKAFRDLAQESGAGPEVVMQGLSEALIATAVGLLVAIPCVIAYNYYQKEIKHILAESDSMSRLLLAHLKSGNS